MYYLLDYSRGIRPVIKAHSEKALPGYTASEDVPINTMPYMPTGPVIGPEVDKIRAYWAEKRRQLQNGKHLDEVLPK